MNLRLIKAGNEHVELLRVWRNADRQNFKGQGYIECGDHAAWYARRPPNETIWIVEADGLAVGTLTVVVEKNNVNVGRVILGNKAFARKGVMAWALTEVMKGFPKGMYFFLDVLADNVAAIGLYEKCGFVSASEEDGVKVMIRKETKGPRMFCVISSFNRPTLIRDCIQSIQQQHFEDFLTVVADDDSNEETLKAIYETIAGDKRFVVLEKAAGSPSPAQRAGELRYCKTINAAIAFAQDKGCEFASFIPDDDYFQPEAFAVRVKTFDECPDVMVSYTMQRSLTFDLSKVWDSAGRVKPGLSYARPGGIDPETGMETNIASWWEGWRTPIRGIDHGSLCVRWSVLDGFGTPPVWWPEGPCEEPGDALFGDRLTAAGYQAWAIPEIGHCKRFHMASYGRVGTSLVRE